MMMLKLNSNGLFNEDENPKSSPLESLF